MGSKISDYVIHTNHLVKFYAKKCAVQEVSLRVHPGEIYGFLGPNGSGKSTVMMMLLGLIAPTQGQISLFGKPFGGNHASIRSRIGTVQEKPYLYLDMTALEYLKFFGQLYGMERPQYKAEGVLDKFGLLPVARKRLVTYSRGMQQKVMIARALIHDPELLLMDEPISGLDPHGIREVWDLLREEKQKGKSIFLSSHHLPETEKICDRIGIMKEGVLLAEDSIDGIRLKYSERQTSQSLEDIFLGITQSRSMSTAVLVN